MKLLAVLGHIKWFVAFVSVVAVSFLSFNPLGGGEYKLTAPFQDSAGLYPGSDVLIAGAKVGTVQDITLRGQYAMVTFSIDSAHAPVDSDATVALRPKSLLGEQYISLQPGTSGHVLQSGTVLSPSAITRAVDLEELVNTFDAPTREKLRTLVIELGGGLAGQGPATNETFTYGTQDMNDLAAIAQTLQNRDQQLQEVISALNAVMAELSRSDRRAELGQLIVNTQRVMATLANEDGRLQQALVETNAALSRTDNGLSGTGPNLAHIMQQLPSLVHNVHNLTNDFGSGLDTLLQPCQPGSYCQEWSADTKGNSLFTELLTGVDEGPVVFGGHTQKGYATRISVIASSGSFGAPTLPGGQKPDCSALEGGAGEKPSPLAEACEQSFGETDGDETAATSAAVSGSGAGTASVSPGSSGSASTASSNNAFYDLLLGGTP